MTTAFERYIGIDYSGAQAPESSLTGLRVYRADTGRAAPAEVLPPPGPRRYWTRRGLADWLAGQLEAGPPTIVGIDHGFSFPLRYFEAHGLAPDWNAFLDDFHRHWPTDEAHCCVDFVRDGLLGHGAARTGEATWRRLSEQRCRAKSVFHFDVPGSVAKSTHAGLPWLRYLRARLGARIHVWPFDGWQVPPGRSAIVEAYPSLLRRGLPVPEAMTGDQFDAWTIAAWLRRADRNGELRGALAPALDAAERAIAGVEGWIIGVAAD